LIWVIDPAALLLVFTAIDLWAPWVILAAARTSSTESAAGAVAARLMAM
jgi:hypothetical protein